MIQWYISVRHIWFWKWKIRYIAIVRRIDWYFYIWILPPQVSPTSYFQFRFFIDLLLLLNKKLELNLHFLLDLILNFWIMASSPEPKDNKDLLDIVNTVRTSITWLNHAMKIFWGLIKCITLWEITLWEITLGEGPV